MQRVKGTYVAVGKAGRQFTVVAKVAVLDSTTTEDEGSPVESEGVLSLETNHGVRLRRVGQGVYRLTSGEVLRSADPDAP
jgi:hypothetical protein